MLAWLRSLNDRSYAMELLETACCTIEPEAKAVTDKDFPLANLPAHIEQTVRSLAQLHADHHQNATLHERPWPVRRDCSPIRDLLVGWLSLLQRG